MTETCKVKVQKSSVYLVHNLNKLQQVKLSAVWILAISLTILVHNRYYELLLSRSLIFSVNA